MCRAQPRCENDQLRGSQYCIIQGVLTQQSCWVMRDTGTARRGGEKEGVIYFFFLRSAEKKGKKKKKNRKKEKKSETKSRGKKKRKTGRKGDRWVSKALVALLGWKRMPLIMRCLFYPPALCLSRCYACFPLAPIISALEPGDNNEFTEIEKCLGLNCMYLVTQTEAMAWERLVSQWHHLATQPL